MVVIAYYEMSQLSMDYDNTVLDPFEIIYTEMFLEIMKNSLLFLCGVFPSFIPSLSLFQ